MAERIFRIDGLGDLHTKMRAVWDMVCKGIQAGPVEVALRRPGQKRTSDQNRKLWPMLADIAKQVQWPVNGAMGHLPPEDWKDVLTAGLDSEQRVAQGINGGFVMLGRKTSRMKKAEFAELIELIYVFGAEHGVAWSEPALAAYAEYREVAA